MADSSADDLDQLLDSALDDFSNLDLSAAQRAASGSGGGAPASSSSSSAAKGMGRGFGLGSGLPELGAAKKKGKQRAVLAPATRESNASAAALEELRRQTKEAVRGLESATSAAAGGPKGDFGFGNVGMEDFVKQFEELAGSQMRKVRFWEEMNKDRTGPRVTGKRHLLDARNLRLQMTSRVMLGGSYSVDGSVGVDTAELLHSEIVM